MRPQTLFGYRFVAHLAVLSLLIGSSACTCAKSSEQAHKAGEELNHAQYPVASCCAGETYRPVRDSECPPVQHDQGCAHCVQPDTQTAKIERVIQGICGPWTPEVLATASVFVTAQDGVQPLTPSSDLSPSYSSGSLLSLICTLLI